MARRIKFTEEKISKLIKEGRGPTAAT